MRKCAAVTKKGKSCQWPVEEWRRVDLCHVHDPEGTFRQQQASKKVRGIVNDNKYKIKNDKKIDIAVAEMLSLKCTSNPFITKCIYPEGIHCNTIDWMIDIVLSHKLSNV
jgi:hypothetical protein